MEEGLLPGRPADECLEPSFGDAQGTERCEPRAERTPNRTAQQHRGYHGEASHDPERALDA